MELAISTTNNSDIISHTKINTVASFVDVINKVYFRKIYLKAYFKPVTGISIKD